MYLSPTYLSNPSLTFFWLKTMSRNAIAFCAFGFLLTWAEAGAVARAAANAAMTSAMRNFMGVLLREPVNATPCPTPGIALSVQSHAALSRSASRTKAPDFRMRYLSDD